MPTEFTPRDSIDRLIARQLPPWLASADVDQLRALHQALRRQQQMAAQVAAHFKGLPSLDTFAAALLEQALRTAGVASPDVRKMAVVIDQIIELPSMSPLLLTNRVTYQSRRSLLSAALHNFSAEELSPSEQRDAWLVGVDGKRLELSFEAFASGCRQLDLGGRYQQLLNSLLSPKTRPTTPTSAPAKAVERMLESNLRAQMEVAMRLARLKGQLDEFAFYRLLPFWVSAPIVDPVPGSATPQQLYLLGKCVQGVVTLEQRQTRQGALQGITVWIPQDPSAAVTEHASWEALYHWFGERLRDERYEDFFSRFISVRDRPDFATALGRLRHATAEGTPLQLDGRHFPLPAPLIEYLRQGQTRKMLDDARLLAVPTADEDLTSRHLRLQAAIAGGLDLLNLAALFVPVLGEIMLVVAAVQIAQQVYEGYEDWSLGDRQGALDHVFGVAETVVLGAAAGAIGSAAVSSLKRVAFVDGLTPVSDIGGSLRLSNARAPIQTVADTGDLIRRFDGPFAETPDWQAQAIEQATGLTADRLRRLHVEGAHPLARLHDAHERLELHNQLPSLRGSAFEGEFAHRQLAESADQRRLRRVFPRLSVRQAGEILEHASSDQLEHLRTTGRLPLAMAEQARWAIRDARLDQACLGLQLPQAVNADTERLAIGLVQRSAPWPTHLRLELREGTAQGPLLAATNSTQMSQVRVIVRTAQGYRTERAPSAAQAAPSTTLWEALLANLEPAQKSRLGRSELTEEQLRQWLAEQAGMDRQRCAEVLGMAPVGMGLRPPRRLSDGRLGYPLSGRLSGGRQAIRSGIHRIYPMLDSAQMDAYVLDLLDRHVDIWEHYHDLNQTLLSLNQALEQWRGEVDLISSLRRRRVATQLRRCWRRKLMDYAGDYVLAIDGERVASLPQLPPRVDFSHVKRLVLRNMGLPSIDEDFLSRFSQITELDLRGNRLTRLPDGLRHLTRLRQLQLANNQIVMSAEGSRQLSRLSHLLLIDLSHNPLGQAPALGGLDRLLHVNLRDTGLESLPDLAQTLPWRAQLDLRQNRIRQLREDALGLWHDLQRVRLHDNPLEAQSAQALDRLTGAGASGSRFAEAHAQGASDDASREHWMGAATEAERVQRTQWWDALREQEGSSDLFRFLADFAETEDFELNPEHYERRVWSMLEAAHGHEALRTRLFETAGGPRTCEDRLLLIMGQLELSVLVERAMIDGPAQYVEARLLGLERSLFRIDILDGIASEHIARMREADLLGIDEIEIRLYYRVKLKQVLGLPATPDTMHYELFAQVTEADLRHAAQTILAAENPQALAASLAQRPFWQSYVRTRDRQRFEALAEPFYERLEALESDTVTSGQLVEASNQLKAELEHAEQALVRTLADEAYARAAADLPAVAQ